MKIWIGVVTFNNSKEQLNKLLLSISRSYEVAKKSFPFELSITGIDNGDACLEQSFKNANMQSAIETKVNATRGNVGFGCAMNILMADAFANLADLFIAVNPDGSFHANCLSEFIKAASQSNQSLLEARQFPEEHPKPYSIETGETPWATGACLAIPRRIYDVIGGFDENLFMYGEDVDISWRAKASGFSVRLLHNAIFVHPTLGRTWSREAKKHFFLSAVYLAVKWQASEFEPQYEEEYRSRFGENESDLKLLSSFKSAAVQSSNSLVHTANFKPQFDKGRAFSDARWSH